MMRNDFPGIGVVMDGFPFFRSALVNKGCDRPAGCQDPARMRENVPIWPDRAQLPKGKEVR